MFKEGIARFLKLDQVMDKLTDYVESRIEILKYDVKDDLSKIASKVSVYLVLIFISTFFLFFLSTAIAFELTRYVGMFWGFTIVSGFYALLALVIYTQRKALFARVEKEIKILTKQKTK